MGSSTAKECSRILATKIKSVVDLKGEPKHNQCHVYYIHRDGTTYCSSNQEFDQDLEPKVRTNVLDLNSSEPRVNKVQNDPTNEIAIDKLKASSRAKSQKIDQCADDRLILV